MTVSVNHLNVLVINEDLLEFHPMCGAHTLVINNNTVAYRPK